MAQIRIVQIYPQYSEHVDARILGNRRGLEILRDTITEALNSPSGRAVTKDEADNWIMANDGEGYSVIVEMNDDDWNGEFWNRPENRPFYLLYFEKSDPECPFPDDPRLMEHS